MSMCDRIKKRRLELNMSQEELALKVGYESRSAINKIELGKIGIQQDKVEQFAEALETTAAYLQGHIDNPDIPLIDLDKIFRRAEELRKKHNEDKEGWIVEKLEFYPLEIGMEIGFADDALIRTVHKICGLKYDTDVTMEDVKNIELVKNFIEDNEKTIKLMMGNSNKDTNDTEE